MKIIKMGRFTPVHDKKTIPGIISDWLNRIQVVFCIAVEINLFGIYIDIHIFDTRLIFETSLPFFSQYTTDLFCFVYPLPKNKTGEFQLQFVNNLKTGIKFTATAHQDHAGTELEISIAGFILFLRLYDTRHWDYNRSTWEASI